MKNHKPKLIMVAIAPIYQGKLLWIEQLFDYLSLFPQAQILLPTFTVSDNLPWEQNLIFPMIQEQYPNIDFYYGNLEIANDSNAFLVEAETVTNKIMTYFDFKNDAVTLELFNEQLYLLLANQFQTLLSDGYQQSYQAFQETLLQNLKVILEESNTDILLLVPLEQAFFLSKHLQKTEAYRFYMYGEDFLEEETREKDKN